MPRKKYSYTPEQVICAVKEKVLGVWEPAHDETGHKYRHVPTGSLVRSVTTKNIVHKQHLEAWKIRKAIEFLESGFRFERLGTDEREMLMKAALIAHKDVVTDAGDVGTQTHHAVEKYVDEWIDTGSKPEDIKTFYPGVDYRVVAAIRSAEAFFNKYKFTPVYAEITVGLPGESAGTLDLLVLDEENRLYVLDWKSSNNVDDFYACQVATYSEYFEKMTKLKVFKHHIIRLDKYSDKFKVYNIVNPKASYLAFKALSKFEEYHNNGLPKLKEDKVIIKI